jgi:two-component system NarL family sensor kinase
VKVKEEFGKTRLLLDKAVKEVRRISENLRPSELDTLGLLAAARGLCEEFRERTRIDLQFQQTGFPVRLSPEVELTLFRIVQEALTNIERHAQATKVGVELAREDALVTLNIRDNGKGFPAGPSPDGMRKGRMGLIGMRERVAFLGGRFLVDSTLDTGTGIAVRIPLRDDDGL